MYHHFDHSMSFLEICQVGRTLHTTDVEGQPFCLSTFMCLLSVMAVVIVTVWVEWWLAALGPLRSPSPTSLWIWKNVQALRSFLYIQVGNERKDTVHSASFLGSHELWKGWSLTTVSFPMRLIFFISFSSHSWILSHEGLSLFSWEVRYENRGISTMK